jgi:hypothetical protein
VKVVFPDGTEVRASPLRERGDEQCDFGVYMDPRWAPTWPAALVDWEDFGLPRNEHEAAGQIAAAFARARAGERVEIGCVGGLGRTGTVLACMAVLAGVPSADAVGWVRENYDARAVETPEQEEFVHSFAALRPRA